MYARLYYVYRNGILIGKVLTDNYWYSHYIENLTGVYFSFRGQSGHWAKG